MAFNCERKINSAAAFWKPAKTGAGMYFTTLPRRSRPNSTWKPPAMNTSRKVRTSSMSGLAFCSAGTPDSVRLCSTMEPMRKVTMLRGE